MQISKLDPDDPETLKMQELVDLLFETFGGRNAIFKFKS